jgi:hypothetical protein
MSKNNTKTVTITTVDQLISMGHTTTSSQIRYLNSIGWKRGDIARLLNKRYQHVRNVLITPLKKG